MALACSVVGGAVLDWAVHGDAGVLDSEEFGKVFAIVALVLVGGVEGVAVGGSQFGEYFLAGAVFENVAFFTLGTGTGCVYTTVLDPTHFAVVFRVFECSFVTGRTKRTRRHSVLDLTVL